jgi:hypothetical protein
MNLGVNLGLPNQLFLIPGLSGDPDPFGFRTCHAVWVRLYAGAANWLRIEGISEKRGVPDIPNKPLASQTNTQAFIL